MNYSAKLTLLLTFSFSLIVHAYFLLSDTFIPENPPQVTIVKPIVTVFRNSAKPTEKQVAPELELKKKVQPVKNEFVKEELIKETSNDDIINDEKILESKQTDVKIKAKPKPLVKLKPIVKSKPKPVKLNPIKSKPIEKKRVKKQLTKTKTVTTPSSIPSITPIKKVVEPKINEVAKVLESSSTIQKASISAEANQEQIQAKEILKQQAKISYQAIVLKHIEEYKKYPRIAQRRSQQGKVLVSFELLANHQITNLEVTHKFRILTNASQKAVNDAQPMPPAPKNVELPLRFSFYMEYKLR